MKALKYLESSHKWTSVLTCISFVCTHLSFIFTCLYSSFTSLSFVFTCLYLSLTRLHLSAVVSNSSSLIFTRLHLSALVSHASALLLSLVCNISNIKLNAFLTFKYAKLIYQHWWKWSQIYYIVISFLGHEQISLMRHIEHICWWRDTY